VPAAVQEKIHLQAPKCRADTHHLQPENRRKTNCGRDELTEMYCASERGNSFHSPLYFFKKTCPPAANMPH